MQIPRRLLPPMHELHAFEAASRTGSVSKAARELNLTQSAVSRQIRALENKLGVELFVREKKSIRLTLAGLGYARSIREALQRLSVASLTIRANPLGGSLNLGVLPTFASRWLAPRLAGFAACYPGINLNLYSRPTPFDFNLDTVDAAIHFGNTDWPDTLLTRLFGESVLAVASPGLARKFTFLTAEDIRQAPLLILLSRPDAWEHWLGHHSAPNDGIHGMMFDQFETMISAACHGLGLALLPTFLIKDELGRAQLIPIFRESVPSRLSYYLACPSERSAYPPLAAFREWLVAETAASVLADLASPREGPRRDPD